METFKTHTSFIIN